MARVDPNNKEPALEIKLPTNIPIALGSLTDDEFNGLMENAVKSYTDGKCADLNEIRNMDI